MAAPAQLILHTFADNQRVKKINIAARYCGVELVPSATFEMGVTNKTPEFLRMNPTGKVPVLETPEGCIFESNAIAKYVASKKPEVGLLGRTPLQQAQVDQWLDFATNEIEPAALTWLGPIQGVLPYDAAQGKAAKDTIVAALTSLNVYLERHTFLVGQRITLADIVVAAALVPLYKMVLAPPVRKPFDNTNRWFELITQQENFSEVLKLGPTAWCTVPLRPKETAKKAAPAKPAAEEGDAPAEGGKKGKNKKKNKKDDDDDDAEEEEEAPKEKEAPNPLDALPKSSFVLDAFKREYSNKSIQDSMQYFWENFDAEGYSLHYCKYKYNDELSKSFMTTNLIGGYFQRLDRCRKYAFGIMLILGEEGKHEIQGCFLFRGPEVPDVVKAVDDTELYEWTKIDYAGIEEHKERVKMFWNYEDVDSLPCIEGKVFK